MRKLNIPATIRGLHLPDSLKIVIAAILTGLLTGLSAIALNWLIITIRLLSFSFPIILTNSLPPLHFVIILGVGGLLNGLIIHFITSEIKGGGIPEIMEAVAVEGGVISPLVAVAKTAATGICLGTGGSAGSVGPIAQIGASIGSSIGQLFKIKEQPLRTLVASGVAGGIAAALNAPIAGAIFAIEIILQNISSVSFSTIVITSTVASTLARQVKGNTPFFALSSYTQSPPLELILFAIVGILAAVFAICFSRMRYMIEDGINKTRIPEYLLPALGGVLVGLIGALSYKLNGIPRIFGAGYETIGEALNSNLPLHMSLILMLLKMIATSLTIGTGNSGGIFAPSLFMGAMLGQTFGVLVNHIFPELSTPPSTYALVGMAAFFSGAARAPISSILIIFELTGNYNLILPLMLAAVSSSLFSKWISKDTIYSAKLTRKGINIKKERLASKQK